MTHTPSNGPFCHVRWLAMITLSSATIAGCYSQEQYNQALQRSADLQLQLDQAKAALAAKTDEVKTEQLKAAELATAKEKAVRSIADTANENQQLRKNLDTARRELGSATASLDAQRTELQRTLDSQKQARARMELELADRDRQIDILRSKVRRLEAEISDLKKSTASAPAAQTAH